MPTTNEEMETVTVSSLRPGDRVDLSSCPYLHDHASAPYEYAEVVSVEQESPDCIAVGYESIDVVGYDPNVELRVRRRDSFPPNYFDNYPDVPLT